MATETTKVETPPYTSYSTFLTFIKSLKETGVPSRIDKSVLSKMSGSAQFAMISALKWLKLVDNAGVPTPKLEELVNADSDQFSEVLSGVLHKRYPFLTDGSLLISKATGTQVEQKFRDFGIQGSTVVKSVAFFIAAAKDAKIELGPHVKAPKAIPSPNGAKRQQAKKLAGAAKSETTTDDNEEDDEDLGDRPGFVKITIPLHGMEDGVVYLPDGLSPAQWGYALKITKFILENYRFETEESPKGSES